jgi:transposase
MQSVTSATAVATTARANNITLFASLELNKSKWVVTINSPGSEKFSKHVVEGGDGACLLDLLSRSRAKAEQRYGEPVKAMVIQEAGLDGFWIHRLLLAKGSRATSSTRLRSRLTGGIDGPRPMRSTARRCCGR